MDLKYVDILSEKKWSPIKLLIWTLIIGQFVYPVGGEGKDGGILLFTSCKCHLIRVHKNLVQHPSNNILIDKMFILNFEGKFNLMKFFLSQTFLSVTVRLSVTKDLPLCWPDMALFYSKTVYRLLYKVRGH